MKKKLILKKKKNEGKSAQARTNSHWSLVVIIFTLPVVFWRYGGTLWNTFLDGEDKNPSTKEYALEVYNLKRKVIHWETGLFKGPTDNILAEIMSISMNSADSSGIEIREKRMHSRMTAPPGWERVGITITGEGIFEDLVEFLNQISFHERYISVDRLQIHPQTGRRVNKGDFEEQRNIRFQVTLSTLKAVKR